MFRGLKRAVAMVTAAAAVALVLPVLLPAPPAHAATTSSLLDRFSRYDAGATWTDGDTNGFWKTVFNGYGRVGIVRDGSKVLSLRPKVADRASETHAALVVSKRTFGDLDMRMRMKTVDQIREGKANPWEVAWSMWNYRDNTHFYYLILKPNGWELGKGDPAYPGAQRFLATGSKSFAVGRWHNIRVRQTGRTMSVWANGQKLTTFTDNERPYTSGSIGVYNEDAKTYFDDVAVASL